MGSDILLIAETNFLADLGYQQDKGAEYLLKCALNSKIYIAIPEVSFYEIYGVIYKKGKYRLELANNLRKESNQLSRSALYTELSEKMKRIAESLENTYYIDLERFDDAINTLKSICTIIPYTESMHKNAYLITLDKRYDLEDPDASIYGSFLSRPLGINEYIPTIYNVPLS
ncbi:MAG: PIN domain-containing protein, partial [Methanosarcinales archaeon]